MKILLSILLPLCLVTGCNAKITAAQKPDLKTPKNKKILVAYFSRTGENYSVGNIKTGNTYKVAKEIARQTNGMLFEIKPLKQYPAKYKECTEVAQEELINNARPAVQGKVEDMQEYDIIYLGYPIWWGDAPMPIYTFLESYDLKGKQIYPFATHEGSGMGNSESALKKALTKVTVEKGLAIYGHIAQNDAEAVKKAVQNWLKN